jgi:hypothetical protein
MKRMLAMAVCAMMLAAGGAFCAYAAPVKKAAIKPVKAAKFGMKVSPEDVIFYTQGNFFIIQSESINSGGNMLYFAAKDFTGGKDLIVKKIEKNEIKVDTPDRKVVKTTFLLGDASSIDPNYKMELACEIRKDLPSLATYSRFIYTGPDVHSCSLNWGLSSAYAKNKYKYYTISKEGKVRTFKLGGEAGDKKIGYTRWLYAHDGRGSGAGLICPAMLGKGEDFIFVNSVPPQKELATNQSMDVFLIFVPIYKNFKILNELYSKIAGISWKFE